MIQTLKLKTSRRLVSTTEAAEYLGCSAQSIRRYISSGRLEGFRMGPRMVRVDLNQIDGILRAIPNAAM